MPESSSINNLRQIVFICLLLAKSSTPTQIQQPDLCPCEFDSKLFHLKCNEKPHLKSKEIGENRIRYFSQKEIDEQKLCSVTVAYLQQFKYTRVHRFEFLNIPDYDLTGYEMWKLDFDLTEFIMKNSKILRMICSENLGNVFEMDLSENKIEILDYDSVDCQSDKLSVLNLSRNNISVIVKDYFANFITLTRLDLSYNSLLSLDLVFNFHSLLSATINLSSNKKLENFRSLELNAKSLNTRYVVNVEVFSMNLANKILPIKINSNISFLNVCTNSDHELVHFNFSIDQSKARRKIRNKLVCSVDSVYPSDIHFSQSYALKYNSKPFDMEFFETTFRVLPFMNLLTNMTSLVLRGNDIDKLHHDGMLPDNIENVDLSNNKIHFISKSFFSQYLMLKSLFLSGNILKNIDHIEIGALRPQTISFDRNLLETFDIYFTNIEEEYFSVAIDLSDNVFQQMPKIKGRQNFWLSLFLDSQVSNEFLNGKSIESLLDNLPQLRFLSLRNNSLTSLVGKARSMNSIDLSLNYLNDDTLCELFYDIKIYDDSIIRVYFFPQLDFNEYQLTCDELVARNFTLNVKETNYENKLFVLIMECTQLPEMYSIEIDPEQC
jgi:Leucine-rich repeat (LRR) protein